MEQSETQRQVSVPRDEFHPGAVVLEAVLLDETTLLIFGSVAHGLPEVGTVVFDSDAVAAGSFRSLIIQRDSEHADETVYFVAVIRVPNIAHINATGFVVQDSRMLYRMPEIPSFRINPSVLYSKIRAEVAEFAPDVFEFLWQALASGEGGPPSSEAERFLTAFLRAMASQDGFIEIMGQAPTAGLMVQGWSFRLRSGSGQVIIEAEGYRTALMHAGGFDRADLASEAHGFVGMIVGDGAVDPGQVKRLFFRSGDGYHYLDVFENRTVLDAGDVGGHLRAMIGQLHTEPATARLLKQACRIDYRGEETVSALTSPIRAAIDHALWIADAGVFIAGWILDPTDSVEAVTLNGSAGFARPVSDGWARLDRTDVSVGYAEEPAFADSSSVAGHDHGFLAFVQCQKSDLVDNGHLEISLATGETGFLPLALKRLAPADIIERLLAVVPDDHPDIEAIVARHIGPAVRGLRTGTAPATDTGRTRVFGTPPRRPSYSVVMPVLAEAPDLDVNFALFANDADFAAAELIIVTPPEHAAAVGVRLAKHGVYYGMQGRQITVTAAAGLNQVVRAGLAAAAGSYVTLLSPYVLPQGPGWLASMKDSLLAWEQAAAISPALLYEDQSIKFAGADTADQAAQGGCTSGAGFPRAGYTSAWLTSEETQPSVACSIECCMFRRAMLADLDIVASGFFGQTFESWDLSFRLSDAGLGMLFAPAVRMMVADPEAGSISSRSASRLLERVDRWGFDSTWGHLTKEAAYPR